MEFLFEETKIDPIPAEQQFKYPSTKEVREFLKQTKGLSTQQINNLIGNQGTCQSYHGPLSEGHQVFVYQDLWSETPLIEDDSNNAIITSKKEKNQEYYIQVAATLPDLIKK
jgi:hypothetical protein